MSYDSGSQPSRWRGLARWPILAGVVILVPAALSDLAFHLLPSVPAGWLVYLGPDGRTAHVATLIGMSIVVLGVVLRGILAAPAVARRSLTSRTADGPRPCPRD